MGRSRAIRDAGVGTGFAFDRARLEALIQGLKNRVQAGPGTAPSSKPIPQVSSP